MWLESYNSMQILKCYLYVNHCNIKNIKTELPLQKDIILTSF